MIKMIKQLALILIAFNWLTVTGCAPAGAPPIAESQVLALGQQTTNVGIYAVLNGAQKFGEVWIKNGNGVIVWPQSGGWAWACVRFDCSDWLNNFRIRAGGNGNLATWRTWSDLVAFMKSDGWTKAGPAALTAGQSISGFLEQMAGSITGFMVVPVALPLPEYLQDHSIQD